MPKLVGYRHAPGSWARHPDRVVALYQVGAQQRVALEDKLITDGRAVGLWLLANSADDGAVACTCVKETAARGEAKCRTCHGSKWAPGYFRFQHETLHASSSRYAGDQTGWVLVDTALDSTLKPGRLALVATALTGTVVTPALAYTNADESDWEVELVGYRRDAGQTVAAEFSTDGGTTWFAVGAINGVEKPIGAGTVQFRVTLTRASVDNESPSFEIVRARHPQAATRTRRVRRAVAPNPARLPVGAVWVLKTWAIEQALRTPVQGRTSEHEGHQSWTAPLDFYSSAYAFGSVQARILDTGEGPHHFFRPLTGLDTDETYVMHQVRYSESTQGMFSYQAFSERKSQAGEHYGLVW